MKRYSVFISSTFADLKEYRKSIHNALLCDGNFPIAMENFNASNQPQWDKIKPLIDECDYFILIVGFYYGSIVHNENISYTQKEYEYALSIGKPILSFFLDESFNTIKDSDLTNINLFKEKIKTSNKLYKFCIDKNNLSSDIISSLHNEINSNQQCGWVKGGLETYINLNELNNLLNTIEINIIKQFERDKTNKISFSKLMCLFDLSRPKLLYHLEKMQNYQLIYYEEHYMSDDTNNCELLKDGRKYLYESLLYYK